MTEKLLPCPFCGNDIAPKALDHNEIDKGDFEYYANPYYSVVCRMNDDSPVPLASWQTGCGAAGGFRPTPEEAIAAWNRRVDDERLKTALKEIVQLACESVEREKTLARLEAEVMAAIDVVRGSGL